MRRSIFPQSIFALCNSKTCGVIIIEAKEKFYLYNSPSLFFNIGPSVLVSNSKDEDVKDDCNDNGNKEQQPEFKVGQESLTPNFFLSS